jgi:hypothetical protein
VGKFTYAQRALVKSIVATLTIEKVPESQIINEIYRTYFPIGSEYLKILFAHILNTPP